MLDRVNAHMTRFIVVVGPSCDPAEEKLTNTRNSALVHYTNVYSLLQFVSSHCEKEREYESWVDRIKISLRIRRRQYLTWRDKFEGSTPKQI